MAGVGETHIEIERKLDVGAGEPLPDLSGVPGVVRVADPIEEQLDATYFDTADLSLLRHKVTLRRRTGGRDAGWHLKRPRAQGERSELQYPLGEPDVVPTEVREPVEEFLRGAVLAPVVRLQTLRAVRYLLAADGAVLAELADDDVTATVPATGPGAVTKRWRELEVELVDGDLVLLAAVVARLVDAGAHPSRSSSKLARALADQLALVLAAETAGDS